MSFSWLFWLCLWKSLYAPHMVMGVLSLPMCSGALRPHLFLDQSRHLVTLSAPSTGPPTSLPLGSQSSAGGSSTLSKKRAPPPPPGHKRTLSDPPSPVLQGPQSKGASRWQHLRFVTAETTFRRHLCWQKKAKFLQFCCFGADSGVGVKWVGINSETDLHMPIAMKWYSE